ncbi:MAG: hypothetical protein ACR2J4_01585 [Deinococcus sp.]
MPPPVRETSAALELSGPSVSPLPGARQLRRENLLDELRGQLMVLWLRVKLLIVLLPLALLIAWGTEVYLALRFGGRHTLFALGGLAVLLVLAGTLTVIKHLRGIRESSRQRPGSGR